VALIRVSRTLGQQCPPIGQRNRLPEFPDHALQSELRTSARPEVTRDNMGHANIGVTQNVYGRSWWRNGSRRSHEQSMSFSPNWSPNWGPRTQPLSQVERIGRGKRIRTSAPWSRTKSRSKYECFIWRRLGTTKLTFSPPHLYRSCTEITYSRGSTGSLSSASTPKVHS
jgi:hypothetical protein